MPMDGDILGVRTLYFTQDELEKLHSPLAVHDKYAEACGGANAAEKLPASWWGGVMHDEEQDGSDLGFLKASQRCHGVAARHEEKVPGLAAKATLITRYRVAYMATGSTHVADFVVSTSHFGKIPSAEDMFRLSARSEELQQAMDAVEVVSDKFSMPTFMTGDWNFRMVPFDELAKFSNFEGLLYSGPVIHMVDGTMRYSYVRRSPMQPDIAYEETRVAYVALRNSDSMRFLQTLGGFYPLYSHFYTFRRRPPTCRFRESTYRPHCETVPLANLGKKSYANTSALSSEEFLSDGKKWDQFKKEGFDLLKGDKAAASVTRLPSQCDQIYWSNNITTLSMDSAWEVLGPAAKRVVTSDHNMLELKARMWLS
ncbi:unnamed protein product [Symbiodinium pilosum]|uniref:Endonuclease/exonuclease/phosphatase domain-containing protein n=1 Tax=Symbiodinium pilosum TaxID=2952 RepID=A0A812NER5_SYMPI|nr:unnamed protein product [Symbiodinium pilosum]